MALGSTTLRPRVLGQTLGQDLLQMRQRATSVIMCGGSTTYFLYAASGAKPEESEHVLGATRCQAYKVALDQLNTSRKR